MANFENVQKLLNYVFEHATEGDADSVIKAFDDYNRQHMMMHVGDKKGSIVDEVIKKNRPKVLVELGAFCGYSAVRFGRLIKDEPKAHCYSFEFEPIYAAVATKVVELAG